MWVIEREKWYYEDKWYYYRIFTSFLLDGVRKVPTVWKTTEKYQIELSDKIDKRSPENVGVLFDNADVISKNVFNP